METKSLSFEQMEEIQGGISWGCAVAMIAYGGALVSLAASTLGTAAVIAEQAFGLGMSSLGIGMGCYDELTDYFGIGQYGGAGGEW